LRLMKAITIMITITITMTMNTMMNPPYISPLRTRPHTSRINSHRTRLEIIDVASVPEIFAKMNLTSKLGVGHSISTVLYATLVEPNWDPLIIKVILTDFSVEPVFKLEVELEER